MPALLSRYSDHKSMLRHSRTMILSVLAFSVLFIAALWLLQEINNYKVNASRIRAQYLHVEGQLSKAQVQLAFDYIESRQAGAKDQLQRELKEETENATGMVNRMYHNLEFSNAQKKQVILQAISGMNDDGKEILVLNADGDAVFPAKEPAVNIGGKSDQWESILNKADGFLATHHINPESNQDEEIWHYIMEFRPYNWYIVRSEYLNEFNQRLKRDVLDHLSALRFGQEGYIFIATRDGKLLIENGDIPFEPRPMEAYRDPDGKMIFELLKEAGTKPEGDHVYYKWKKLRSDTITEKMTYVKSFDEWGWLIGSGVYLDDLQDFMAIHKQRLLKKIHSTIIRIVILVALIMLISFWLISRFSKRVKNDYARLSRFLEQASIDNIEIDPEKFSYREMKELARVSNRMVRSRIKTAEDLKVEKLYFERLLESAPEGVVVTDKEGYVLRANNKFLSIFNYTPEEVPGNHIDDLIAPEELKREANKYTMLVGQGKDLSRETIRQTSDGRRLYVSILATPITTKDGMETFYVIYRDITDRKESEKKLKIAMEKAKESDRLKTAFLSNMSHEIRTPLNAIVGFSELISANEHTQTEKKEYAKLISHNSKLLVTLINDIIDVSKIESGQLKIIKKDLLINELMQSLYDSFENYRLQNNRDKVEWIFENDTEDHCIRSDPARLRQILTNLLTNAFKFTESGYVKMGYCVESGFVHFYVKDTGLGIAKADIDKIFLRFQQADDSMTRKYGGTGLGLSISQSLVQLLGGTMKVKSEKNKGSEFSFRIPDEPCTSNKPSREAAGELLQEPAEMNATEKPVILVVEDEDSNYLYIKAVLMPRGYEIIRAAMALKAVELVNERDDIDLVLMDIQLPDYSGYEATRQIKALRPELPVIAQTAYAMADEKENSFAAGCDDYLSKPINKGKLLKMIRQYISG